MDTPGGPADGLRRTNPDYLLTHDRTAALPSPPSAHMMTLRLLRPSLDSCLPPPGSVSWMVAIAPLQSRKLLPGASGRGRPASSPWHLGRASGVRNRGAPRVAAAKRHSTAAKRHTSPWIHPWISCARDRRYCLLYGTLGAFVLILPLVALPLHTVGCNRREHVKPPDRSGRILGTRQGRTE
jgi:hypothetical protein